jgi:DNA-binding MarR family transcriptional regulator
METMHDDNCFALCQAKRFISQIYGQHLANVGLTTTQYSILDRLHKLGDMTTRQLSVALGMGRTSIVRAIRPMQRDGLLESRKDGGHHELTIALLKSGVARLNKAFPHWIKAQSEFEKRLGSQRVRALRRELFDLTDD